MEFSVPHGGMPTAPHVHPRQVETYTVLEGAMEILVGRSWTSLGPGDSATVPAGTPHAFRNRPGTTARFHNVHDPALRFEEYFRAVNRLAQAGMLKERADPGTVLRACVLMNGHGDTIRAATAPQHAAVGALAILGRLLGYSRLESAGRGGPVPAAGYPPSRFLESFS